MAHQTNALTSVQVELEIIKDDSIGELFFFNLEIYQGALQRSAMTSSRRITPYSTAIITMIKEAA